MITKVNLTYQRMYDPKKSCSFFRKYKQIPKPQVLEYFSCLCCALSIKSSIFFISSTLWSQLTIVGGSCFFQWRGMQAAFNRCRTINFLYIFVGMVETFNKKKAGPSAILYSVNFLVIFWPSVQKCVDLQQDQNMWSCVPLPSWYHQQRSVVLG